MSAAARCSRVSLHSPGLRGINLTEIKEEKRAATNSRPWLHGREFFARFLANFFSNFFSAIFEQKPASNLIPKRAAVRYEIKTRRLNQTH
jgi:hypothetical protein